MYLTSLWEIKSCFIKHLRVKRQKNWRTSGDFKLLQNAWYLSPVLKKRQASFQCSGSMVLNLWGVSDICMMIYNSSKLQLLSTNEIMWCLGMTWTLQTVIKAHSLRKVESYSLSYKLYSIPRQCLQLGKRSPG